MLMKIFQRQSTLINQYQKRNFRAAVLLAGCGNKDGTDPTEAASLMISLSKFAIKYDTFSVKKNQQSIESHLPNNNQASLDKLEKNKEDQLKEEKQKIKKRSILDESNKLARGQLKLIQDIQLQDYEVLLIPGGAGVLKNFSDYKFDGKSFKVEPSVSALIKNFNQQNKYIGVIGHSALLVSQVFAKQINVKLVMNYEGDKQQYNQELELISTNGHSAESPNFNQIVYDEQNRIISTPGYSNDNLYPSDVYERIHNLVNELSKLQNPTYQPKEHTGYRPPHLRKNNAEPSKEDKSENQVKVKLQSEDKTNVNQEHKQQNQETKIQQEYGSTLRLYKPHQQNKLSQKGSKGVKKGSE
ncbi:UNKNOWN [Stylonychia lemnae]|uniref:DJ-1/PfpI domain-containing protein n=1 Tax=Stylonychia lemnae TaxID=5949 RepID=A0A077ZS77_STYLE|nr:UNKNOWN [Stylonychia lemnae]|eukprot:CDW72732.1 UNKNOWN [Stylonychia lemnae]